MKRTFFILFCLVACNAAFSQKDQKDEKVTFEQVKQQCSGLPLEKKARISVTRFTVTTSTTDRQQQSATQQNARANNSLKALSMLTGGGGDAPRADEIPPTLGENLTTMLTNALQGVNCFRVLESLKNNDDLTGEINAGTGGLSSKKAPKAGKQLGAQIVVTGEVIEFSDKAKGLNVMGVGSSKKTVKMGFNVKMINPETRDVIVSHVFRVQSRASHSISVLGLVGSSASDPATAAVMEDGVVQAVEFISHIRDSLNIDVNNIPGSASRDPNAMNDTEISLAGANFTSFNNLAKIIASVPGYQSMDKSFSGGIGSYTVSFKGSADKLLDAISAKLGSQYEVMGVDAGKIELKAK